MTTRKRRFARARRWYRRVGGTASIMRSSLVAGITAGAMYVSYWHIAFVAAYAGEGRDSAHIEPFTIDALLILSSLTRAADKRNRLRPRRWATGTLIGMAALTLVANGASAYLRGAGLWGIGNATVVAVALVAGTEILTTKGRSAPRIAKPRTATKLVSVPTAA